MRPRPARPGPRGRLRSRFPPEILRLVTGARGSFPEPLVWSGISGRSSTSSSSSASRAWSRASRRSRVTTPVRRRKIRSKRARSAADPRRQPQLPDDDVLVALEPRAGRCRHGARTCSPRGPRARWPSLAAPLVPPCGPAASRLWAPSPPLHARGLDLRPAAEPREAGDLRARRRVPRAQPRDLAAPPADQPLQLLGREILDRHVAGCRHAPLASQPGRAGNPQDSSPARRSAPLTPIAIKR
jgi:hypothetical protein